MSAAGEPTAREYLPSRGLPLLYVATGLLSLAFAFAAVAANPAAIAGFFYHPRMLAVVHLVTLGWIGGSVLGAIHIVGPVALRMPLRATRGDYAAFSAFAVGTLGMVSHFWLESPRGMVWGAGLVTFTFVRAAVRVLPRLLRARLPLATKLPIALAFANIVLAASLGVLLGLNKIDPFLPVHHLQAVFAHAHLAALGFATLVVMGAGYRLLPMMLPAGMPPGRGPLLSAVLLEAGVLGLAASFFLDGTGRKASALAAAAGILVFLFDVVGMLRSPRPAPPARPRPDPAMALALVALSCLAVTVALGLSLVLVPDLDASSPLALVYGTLGLLGFLAPMIVAVQQRLLPLAAWLWAYADSGHGESPASLHTASGRVLPFMTLLAWPPGVALVAMGLALERLGSLRAGAVLLLLATLAHGAGLVLALHRLRLAPKTT